MFLCPVHPPVGRTLPSAWRYIRSVTTCFEGPTSGKAAPSEEPGQASHGLNGTQPANERSKQPPRPIATASREKVCPFGQLLGGTTSKQESIAEPSLASFTKHGEVTQPPCRARRWMR